MRSQGQPDAAGAQGYDEMMGLIAFYKENARLLREAFIDMGFPVHGGTNAPYLWVNMGGRDGAFRPSWDAFAEILQACDIVTTPGSGFGPAGDGFIRVSAFSSRENVHTAIERFRAHYKS